MFEVLEHKQDHHLVWREHNKDLEEGEFRDETWQLYIQNMKTGDKSIKSKKLTETQTINFNENENQLTQNWQF